jgi:hypothetical protein
VRGRAVRRAEQCAEKGRAGVTDVARAGQSKAGKCFSQGTFVRKAGQCAAQDSPLSRGEGHCALKGSKQGSKYGRQGSAQGKALSRAGVCAGEDRA